MFMFPKIHVLKSNPVWLGALRQGLGKVIGLENRALMNEISAHIKELERETPKRALTPSDMWGCSEMTAIYEQGSRLSPDTKFPRTSILTSQLPELWEIINFCCL